MPQAGLRALPSVEKLLKSSQALALAAEYGRPLTLQAIRAELESIRSSAPDRDKIPTIDQILSAAAESMQTAAAPSLLPVINASGVILHTNLGRAPLSQAAALAARQAASEYTTLEYDLAAGGRGSRQAHCDRLICQVTGAEAALVVNNNAAAVLLALSAMARRRRVIISRTQLVEVGGGFRIPDVMAQSGARLVEVGATNRVHLQDYESALCEPAAFILRAHSSNFRIIGFTSEPPLEDLAKLAHGASAGLIDDLGSGALLDTSRFGMAHEPTVQESLAAGADLVCFSGDKLLGGPQAGIIAGKKALVDKLRRHPLARALRTDKMSLAALSATLRHYLLDEAQREIPVWKMISRTAGDIRQQAYAWQAALGVGDIVAGVSTVGGGSLPGETLPTALLSLHVDRPVRILELLRKCQPPVIARLQEERILLDPRTVMPGQDEVLITCLRQTLAEFPAKKPV